MSQFRYFTLFRRDTINPQACSISWVIYPRDYKNTQVLYNITNTMLQKIQQITLESVIIIRDVVM
jgi:hypothetical protein